MFLECGIKPIWVFDGVPPEAKRNELRKWRELKEKAKEKLDTAKELNQIDEWVK